MNYINNDKGSSSTAGYDIAKFQYEKFIKMADKTEMKDSLNRYVTELLLLQKIREEAQLLNLSDKVECVNTKINEINFYLKETKGIDLGEKWK